MKLVNGGITINVSSLDAQRYLNAGFTRAIEQPVERQAVELTKPQTQDVEPVEAQVQETEALEPVETEQPVEKGKTKERKKNGKS